MQLLNNRQNVNLLNMIGDVDITIEIYQVVQPARTGNERIAGDIQTTNVGIVYQ